MRGLVPGLATPYPLAEILPSLLREDPFAQSICGGLDEVLAPVISTLDSLPAYLDPATVPEDMLGWLAGWMGLALDDHQTAELQRKWVKIGVDLLQRRGTVGGMESAVAALFGTSPEIIESGGASWSASAGSELPGSAEPDLLVRLQVDDPATFDLRRLDALIGMIKPAHVPHRVEVFGHA